MKSAPFLAFVLALAASGPGCKKSSRDDTAGLPKATDWSAPQGGSGGAAPGGGDPHGGDPHAGMDMGGDPHAGMDMGGGDPHAGMDMGGGDPHAGMDMGGAPELEPPDPNRAIDPSQFLRGKIVPTDETKALIKPGAIVFLSVRPVEPTSGEVIGSPLAVARLDVQTFPLVFSLDGNNAMSKGTDFKGDVVIVARVDGDGEAKSKEPGDVEGSVRAKIPADNLTLSLDTVLR
jgi:hypothetical protein